MPLQEVLWITPSDVDGPQRSFALVSAALGDCAAITLHGLDVWRRPLDSPYDMGVEVDAVLRHAEAGGAGAFHLFGFSAGATVALAVALAGHAAVRSICLFEPASIGDDDWSPVETQWRAEMSAVRALRPVEDRPAAFARSMLAPGAPAVRRDYPPRTWDTRTDTLEALLADVGFASGDLAAVSAPVLVMTGGGSHPRFACLAERLVEVLPGAAQVTFPESSHLSPPMRTRPAEVAQLLRDLWAGYP